MSGQQMTVQQACNEMPYSGVTPEYRRICLNKLIAAVRAEQNSLFLDMIDK